MITVLLVIMIRDGGSDDVGNGGGGSCRGRSGRSGRCRYYFCGSNNHLNQVLIKARLDQAFLKPHDGITI